MAAPVYLFTGPEIGEKNDQVAAVKAALKKKYGDSDDYVFYASSSKAGGISGQSSSMSLVEDVIVRLRTESLFIPATCIVLREAEAIKKKDEIDLIAEWIESVSSNSKSKAEETRDSSVLILVSDEISVDPKLDKLIPKENKKVFWEMFENKKEEWVRNFFRKNGYTIEYDAIETVLDMIENNTEALRSECSRFFYCFPKDHVIDVQDVEKILTNSREETPFTLFNAMADPSVSPQKRLENSETILQKLVLTKSFSAVPFIAGLTTCFRQLQTWHNIHMSGDVNETVLNSNGFKSKKIRSQYTSASRIWGPGQCVAIIALLSATDMEIRLSGTSLQNVQLSLLMYEIILKNGASCAKYE